MGDRSAIQWTEATWNPITGCTEVSPGCDHCYAAKIARGRMRERYIAGGILADGQDPTDGFAVRMWPERLDQPLRWKRPRMIFVNSMSDLFHKAIPAEFVDRIWRVMLEADWHTYQILTKRPARAATMIHQLSTALPVPPHIWIGTSVENQAVDYRIRHLLQVPATVRFLSCEPLIGPLWLEADRTNLDWVIIGGESGPNARPMNLGWARSIIFECQNARIPVFVKQLGCWVAGDEEGFIPQRWLFPDGRVWVPGIIGEHNWRRPRGAIAFGLLDKKGGEMSQWAEDLRIRDWPSGIGESVSV